MFVYDFNGKVSSKQNEGNGNLPNPNKENETKKKKNNLRERCDGNASVQVVRMNGSQIRVIGSEDGGTLAAFD